MVDIAQLVSASDCGSEGRGFESHYPPQKKKRHPLDVSSFSLGGLGFEESNAGVQWTPACRQLDGGNTLIFAKGENANESLIHPSLLVFYYLLQFCYIVLRLCCFYG